MNSTYHAPDIHLTVKTAYGETGTIIDVRTREFYNGQREVSYVEYCVQFDAVAQWATAKQMVKYGWEVQG